MITIGLVGGPLPYREALALRLTSDSAETLDLDPDDLLVGDRRINAFVVYCDDHDGWERMTALAPTAPTVAVIANLSVDDYVRALAAGAGVVHLDTSTAIIANVVSATVNGEALFPLSLATELARLKPPTRNMISEPLTPNEREVASNFLAGQSSARIGEALSLSDRTVRRRLQSIYLKLGVSNRFDAYEVLRNIGVRPPCDTQS